MAIDKIEHFKTSFFEFRSSQEFQKRQEQKAILPLAKEIIEQVLKKEELSNQDLTDLIQILKYNCKPDTFNIKLNNLVLNEAIKEDLKSRKSVLGITGYTNAGKTGISKLTPKQLLQIKEFLTAAFSVENSEEAEELCSQYEAKKIPQVKRGVYSPWLFYINPELFPIFNNSYNSFISWYSLPKDYPSAISAFHELKQAVGETDFSGIDAFGHRFLSSGRVSTEKVHYLEGKKLYKISHGIFLKKPKFKSSQILKILEENNWISLHKDTGKKAGVKFESEIQIGDLIYLCYGGDRVIYIAEVKSDAKKFPSDIAQILGNEETDWIYREVKPLYYADFEDISELKEETSQTMPSGNSTFWKIKTTDLENLNDLLFIPYFNLQVLEENPEDYVDEELDDEKPTMYSESTNPLNLILYGPPGTGKTFHSITHAVSIIDNEPLETLLEKCNTEEGRKSITGRYKELVESENIVFTTFHQSLSYEDFIEGIKPLPPVGANPIQYDIRDGIFKELCTKASDRKVLNQNNTNQKTSFEDAYEQLETAVANNPDLKFALTREGKDFTIMGFSTKSISFKKANGGTSHTLSKNTLKECFNGQRESFPKGLAIYYKPVFEKLQTFSPEIESESENERPLNHVLIIDEINRGNVSQIFGELITLIEPDKRNDKKEEISVTLPYSKDEFTVPSNLYIIGTMNTADRSVEALDTALRRRFSFKAMLPEPEKLAENCEGINLQKLLNAVNSRLEVLKDLDHTVGHAWFWNVNNLKDLKEVYANKILPLLQEFFYNDYEKLGLVLGDSFFEENSQVSASIFAKFSGGNGIAGQYEQVWRYKLKDPKDLQIEDFQSLYA
jgi:hypothetical protein